MTSSLFTTRAITQFWFNLMFQYWAMYLSKKMKENKIIITLRGINCAISKHFVCVFNTLNAEDIKITSKANYYCTDGL